MLKPFAPIPNGFILLVRRGVYRVSRLFVLDGIVYAKHGGGYVKVHAGADKGTSAKGVHWVQMSLELPKNRIGYFTTPIAEAA